MPTRPKKGNHGHADSGSKERGGQKAVVGSTRTPGTTPPEAGPEGMERGEGTVDDDGTVRPTPEQAERNEAEDPPA
jgi:hypothetical protein